MAQRRYNAVICFDSSTIRTVELVLQESSTNKKPVFLVSAGELIKLHDCSHNVGSLLAPVHGRSKIRLRGLGTAFGIDLDDAKFDQYKGKFACEKRTKSGIRAAGDWEATDNGPYPHHKKRKRKK